MMTQLPLVHGQGDYKMTRWLLSNLEKKNVQELEYFKHPNHDKLIIVENWWRWGTFECESDEAPNIDLDNLDPDGFYVYDSEYDFSTVGLDDGVSSGITWPDDMPQEDRESLQDIFDEDGYGGWEDIGIDPVEADVIIYGKLSLEKDE